MRSSRSFERCARTRSKRSELSSTSQGADLLAETLDAVVLMPDFLEGGLPLDIHPPDTEEKKRILLDFMKNRADPPRHTANLLQVQKEAKERWPGVKGWGAYDFCWARMESEGIVCGDQTTSW